MHYLLAFFIVLILLRRIPRIRMNLVALETRYEYQDELDNAQSGHFIGPMSATYRTITSRLVANKMS